ncbi:bifunctional hydroxymethylpyrimidine kinase/phosphomethylpyrimidine kinase [Chloroflexus sp. MS-G]|jgi:hydroxymethylpyrimidine/phosphomethylpyrimidine kinase|uniref:bifunctional hydroxymethylpyrimidine kinase/phosphomethylpyrimidine kinase n=1 Tax=Chloroflexus sp. MS-G TaxID=1521187 RepID=UPI0004DF7886|nr:bifunctional hydroxymethylpyrimidine kinase/phosphomethylpyrimidine kinase [Chloroflexus sp. MS-G]
MTLPRCLTIAGSDSGGGAGIQADLKAFAALGVYGMSALTAVTAQNTVGVQGVIELPAAFVGQQIDSVVTDIGVDAVKTGMLANADIIAVVAEKARTYQWPHLVVDPVMMAKSGDPLLRPEAQQALISLLFPLATIVTPNIPEARALTGLAITTVTEMEQAAQMIHAMGPRWVLVKGGHLQGDSVDVLFDGAQYQYFTAPRIETRHTHGTGCTFASAIAAGLAKGLSVPEAVQQAKDYITTALRHAPGLGNGHGPVHHFAAWYGVSEA